MRRFSAITLLIALLTAALALCACGSSDSSAASSSEGAESQATSESASVESSSAEAVPGQEDSTDSADEQAQGQDSSQITKSGEASDEGSQAAEIDSAGETAGFDFVDECTDEHGNITLYALTELKGWQVATLLDQQGYEWDDLSSTWVRMEDGAQFSAYKNDGTYTIDTYNQMNEKGGAIVAVGFNIVAGYKDPQEALKGNAKCVVEDSYFNGNDGIAIFYGPSMQEYLAIISQYSESTTQFEIFSQGAVGSGMLDQLMGEQVGGSFTDVWKAVTGQDSYGH